VAIKTFTVLQKGSIFHMFKQIMSFAFPVPFHPSHCLFITLSPHAFHLPFSFTSSVSRAWLYHVPAYFIRTHI